MSLGKIQDVSEAPRPTIPVPPMPAEEDESGDHHVLDPSVDRRPYFLFVSGAVRPPFLIEGDEVEIGRREEAHLRLDEPAVSRTHAFFRRTAHGTFVIEDHSSVNRTLLNGEPLSTPTIVRDGDRLQFGTTLVKFALQDDAEERHQHALYAAAGMPFAPTEAPTSTRRAAAWTPETWKSKPIAQEITYDDPAEVEAVFAKLRRLPPLVTSWEIEELKSLIADAQEGRQFLLQGGDCAEMFEECESEQIAAKLKILIQMSIVLIRSARRPVIRIGRFAGQYAKPRSRATEVRDGVELPSYFGDLVNRSDFTAEARKPRSEAPARRLHARGGDAELRPRAQRRRLRRSSPPGVLRPLVLRARRPLTRALQGLPADLPRDLGRAELRSLLR